MNLSWMRAPRLARLSALLGALLLNASAPAETFEVGPGRMYTEIEQVPWETLAPGDIVRIHWREDPYRSKWVIARAGTAQAPIIVSGVLGPEQQRPVIDGENARTRLALNYWNENRGVIKVGGSSIPAGPGAHLVIEGLEIRGAHTAYRFTDDNGNSARYTENAAAIFIEHGEHVTIRNCVLHDSGNGLFVANLSRDITVEHSYLFGNGNVDSIFHHNAYTEALGMLYQYNRFGPLRSGAAGNNLKDRSAGLVVRYNWIEDGNRQLDLVESSKFAGTNEPSYRTTYVYGNVLVEHDGQGNRQIVHYGGDSGDQANYRNGVMYFYHNTIVSERSGRTTLFRLSSSGERADIRNNVFYNAGPPGSLEIGTASGRYDLSNNWIRSGYVASFDSAFSGTISHQSTVSGDDPGFIDRAIGEYRPRPNSPVANLAGPLAIEASSFPVSMEYQLHQQRRQRTSASPLDLGALEAILDPEPAPSVIPTPPLAIAFLALAIAVLGRLAFGPSPAVRR